MPVAMTSFLSRAFDLVGCGLAVVAGDLDMDLFRDQVALEQFDLVQDGVRHGDTVAALLLGHRDGDRILAMCLDRPVGIGLGIGLAGVVIDVTVSVFGGVTHVGYVADVDGRAFLHPRHQVRDIAWGLEEGARVDPQVEVVLLAVADAALEVGVADTGDDLASRDAVGRQFVGPDLDPDLLPAPADRENPRRCWGSVSSAAAHWWPACAGYRHRVPRSTG